MISWTQIAKVTSPSTRHLIYDLDNFLPGLQPSFVNWVIIIGLFLGLNEVTLIWTWMSLALKLSIKVNHYPFRMVPLGTIGRELWRSQEFFKKKKKKRGVAFCPAEELDQSGSGVLSQSPRTHSSKEGRSVVKLEKASYLEVAARAMNRVPVKIV